MQKILATMFLGMASVSPMFITEVCAAQNVQIDVKAEIAKLSGLENEKNILNAVWNSAEQDPSGTGKKISLDYNQDSPKTYKRSDEGKEMSKRDFLTLVGHYETLLNHFNDAVKKTNQDQSAKNIITLVNKAKNVIDAALQTWNKQKSPANGQTIVYSLRDCYNVNMAGDQEQRDPNNPDDYVKGNEDEKYSREKDAGEGAYKNVILKTQNIMDALSTYEGTFQKAFPKLSEKVSGMLYDFLKDVKEVKIPGPLTGQQDGETIHAALFEVVTFLKNYAGSEDLEDEKIQTMGENFRQKFQVIFQHLNIYYRACNTADKAKASEMYSKIVAECDAIRREVPEKMDKDVAAFNKGQDYKNRNFAYAAMEMADAAKLCQSDLTLLKNFINDPKNKISKTHFSGIKGEQAGVPPQATGNPFADKYIGIESEQRHKHSVCTNKKNQILEVLNKLATGGKTPNKALVSKIEDLKISMELFGDGLGETTKTGAVLRNATELLKGLEKKLVLNKKGKITAKDAEKLLIAALDNADVKEALNRMKNKSETEGDKAFKTVAEASKALMEKAKIALTPDTAGKVDGMIKEYFTK